MVEPRETALQEYWESGIDHIEGWVSKDLLGPLEIVASVQYENQITGSALEIGVHHGKFFIALLQLLRKGEFAVGVDVFSAQHLNIDFSGEGREDLVHKNISEHSSSEAAYKLINADSLTLLPSDAVRMVGEFGRFRLVSVDGGHTAVHTVSDLEFSQQILASGGVVILDDFVNPHWPGVVEGFFRFFGSARVRIAPFFWGPNKLFLADFSYHQRYFDAFQHALQNHPRFKRVCLCSHDLVAV